MVDLGMVASLPKVPLAGKGGEGKAGIEGVKIRAMEVSASRSGAARLLLRRALRFHLSSDMPLRCGARYLLGPELARAETSAWHQNH